MKSMTARLLMFVALMLVFCGYMLARLVPGVGWPMVALIVTSFAIVISYFALWGVKAGPFLRAYKNVIYFLMGFLSFLATLVILRDVICLPLSYAGVAWAKDAFAADGSWGLIGGAVLGVLFGMYNVWRGPRIRTVSVPIESVTDVSSVRIAQISDLHIGTGIGKSFVEHAVQTTLDAKPSIVVLTGDIADGSLAEFAPTANLLKKLTSVCEVVFVPGNHEYYWNAPQWLAHFESLGIRVLQNEGFTPKAGGGALWLGGVIDPTAAAFIKGAKPDAAAALKGARVDQVKVLLSHHPGIAHTAADVGFDLQLSGHTHAGQFFPFTLIVRKVHEFSNGLKAAGKMWVYVSPGTGHWGPPIRLGTTPEITLLTLHSLQVK
jgi:predicted MPP superfamily phosphohydrolase